MPANKNSGRKKKIIVPGTTEERPTPPLLPPKKKGRPRKKDVVLPKPEDPSIESLEEVDVPMTKSSGKSKTNVAALASRNADVSKLYDKCVGKAIEFFPTSRLPTNRVILQRYRHLRAAKHFGTLVDIIKTITLEVTYLLNCSLIPYKSNKDCQYLVRKLIDKWLNAKGFERESPSFLNGLENLLDLRPTNLYDLDNLAQALKNHVKRVKRVNLYTLGGKIAYLA